MITMLGEDRMKGLAKRLRKVLLGLGVDLKHPRASSLAPDCAGSKTGTATFVAISTSRSAFSTTNFRTATSQRGTHSR